MLSVVVFVMLNGTEKNLPGELREMWEEGVEV
jgi:hypothetical protein